MSEGAQFDYYYGAEADQFSFIRIPKLVIVDPKFSNLSLGAKMLYGLLLDRMNLSMKHGWLDEENRVYIRFKINDIGEALAISEPTATKYLKELENIGLVEKKRIGLGIGNILYVKNFISPDLKDKALITLKNLRNGDEEKYKDKSNSTSQLSKNEKCDAFKSSKHHIHKNFYGIENKKNKGNEIQKSLGNEVKKSMGNEEQDFCGQSKNDSSNINNSDIISNPIQDDKYYEFYKNRAKSILGKELDEIDTMPKYQVIKAAICDIVKYDALTEMHPFSQGNINNIIDAMVEIMMITKPTIMISGNEYDADYVKSRVFGIFSQHIEYMLECLKNNTTKVGNIKAYLRATIFNCTMTQSCYIDSNVQSMLAGNG